MKNKTKEIALREINDIIQSTYESLADEMYDEFQTDIEILVKEYLQLKYYQQKDKKEVIRHAIEDYIRQDISTQFTEDMEHTIAAIIREITDLLLEKVVDQIKKV